MTPADWTTLSNWIVAFRARHSEARKGKLDDQELARYEQDRDVLVKALMIAQRLAIKPGHTTRERLRVSLELKVEIVLGARREKVTTLDLGLGGFAAMVQKPFGVPERVEFVLSLRSVGGAVGGHARVVNVQRKGRPYRVAFAFEDLSPGDAERLNEEVFEAALAAIPPR